MRLLLLVLITAFPAFTGETVLDNDYVRITRNAAAFVEPTPECADRIIVALGDTEISSGGTRQTLARGNIAVFGPGQSCELREGSAYLEVSIKSIHPPTLSPGEIIPPEKNPIRHDGTDFFVFEEKLALGDTRPTARLPK